jgi:hypothetical protein
MRGRVRVTVNQEIPVRAHAARPIASLRTDLITLLFATWFTSGLFLDAWAHNNVPELESFFTAWHGVFYSGFVATAAWVVWTCRALMRARRWDVSVIPVGYASSLVSLGVFALAGLGDMTWHEVFGIEQSIDILFSPTHVALGASMLVIVTTPLRSAWADRAPSPQKRIVVVGSVALAATIVLLFLQYANAFDRTSMDVVVALTDVNEAETARLVSSIAVTNLVLLLPLLMLARRWVLPPGSVTLLYLPVAVLAGAVTGFANVDLLIGLLVGGIVVDLTARWLRVSPDRPLRLRAFAVLAPLVTWTGYVAVAALTPPPVFLAPGGGSHPPEPMVELYTGVPVVQAMIGLLVASIMLLGRGEP